MKTIIQIRTIACAALFLIVLLELSGCGSPPPPPRSASKQIKEAESAMDNGNMMVSRHMYEQAVTEYTNALSQIRDAESFATGNELARLQNLKEEAQKKKVDNQIAANRKAGAAAAKPKTTVAAGTTAPAVDPDEAKRLAAKKREAELAENRKEMDAALNQPKKKKTDEPEDAGEVAAGKAKEPKAPATGENAEPAPDAPKAPPKDKNGIFADPTPASPVLQVVKLVRNGKQVMAFCQYYNKTDDGKRITVYNYFKDRDNQVTVPPLTAASFPYDHFNIKAKDLFEQSIRNIAPDREEINGHEFFQFVSIGECANDEAAQRTAKLYVEVRLHDGTKLDATGPEGGNAASMPDLKMKMPK